MILYHNDHLGTPQKMTASNGAVVWSAKYEAFGKAQVAPESTVVNNLRFPGQYWDSETGLHYNWHRYYDPEIGRYLRVDPIGLQGGINLFAYALDDSINKTDPLGRKVKYSVYSIGGSLVVAEGDIGFAYAESDCRNGEKYIAIYSVVAAGFNVGIESKLGKIFKGDILKFLVELSKVTSNTSTLLGGDTFSLEGYIPKERVSYLDVGAFQGGVFYTGSIIDIQLGPHEGGRRTNDPMFNHGFSGNIGLSLAKAVGYNIKRRYMKKIKCCEF